MEVVPVRPLIDAVALLGLGPDAEEEQQALLLLVLHHLAVGEPAALGDLIELRLGVHLRGGAGGNTQSASHRKRTKAPHNPLSPTGRGSVIDAPHRIIPTNFSNR